MLKGKRILFVIAPSDFRDEELFHTKDVLESEGARIDIASTKTGRATGMLGGTVDISLLVSDVDVSDYDAVVFVGGTGVAQHELYNNETILNIARQAYNKGKVVAAICIAPRILAKAGLLKNRKATVFPDDESVSMLKAYGADYSTDGVVVDGRIITANGPHAAYDFGRAIASSLNK